MAGMDSSPLDAAQLRELARRLAHGEIVVDEFLRVLDASRTATLPDASVDLDRQRRCGYPEVIYGESKPAETIGRIVAGQLAAGLDVLATRVSAEKAAELSRHFPTACYNAVARTLRISAPNDDRCEPREPTGHVVIVTAGTTDLPVAEEARETLLWMGIDAPLIQDVGVAGPHRLLERLPEIRGADAVIVIAGMEGALPSVVGGHVDCPVIAVPTSVGYGAAFGGVAALLGMLNSCASNVTVVNIDAGFKAAYVAGLIARRAAQPRTARVEGWV